MRNDSSKDLIDTVAKNWSLIARRLEEYPFLSPQEVLNLLSISQSELTHLEECRKIIALRFGPDFVRYPRSQFEMTTNSIHPVVPSLLDYLAEFDDLIQLHWLTTYQDELNSRPIDVLSSPDMAEQVVESARFYYSFHVEHDSSSSASD